MRFHTPCLTLFKRSPRKHQRLTLSRCYFHAFLPLSILAALTARDKATKPASMQRLPPAATRNAATMTTRAVGRGRRRDCRCARTRLLRIARWHSAYFAIASCFRRVDSW